MNFKVGDRIYVEHFKQAGTIQKIYELTGGCNYLIYRTKMDKNAGRLDQDGCLDWRYTYIRPLTPLEELI